STEPNLIEGRIVYDYPVVVDRITLRQYQALPATGRTTIEVRQLWARTVKVFDHKFGHDRRQMCGAIAKVDLALTIIPCEKKLAILTLVPHIGRRSGVSSAQNINCTSEEATPASTSFEHQLFVPISQGQTNTKTDRRINHAEYF